ncbi:MAG: universal stress protein [Actinomycetia bacterium]|nr:universal stress protein [Actinomycetes bacterium]
MSKMLVVGYDGSEASDLAVRWAAESASARGLTLEVVVAWSVPPSEVGIGAGAAYETQLLDALRDEATQILEKGMGVAVKVAPGVKVSGHVAAGPPAGVLIDAAEDAELLVVGSHGRSGLTGLILGSVSRQVSGHAKCPTVVVRPPEDPDAREVVVGVDGSEPSLRALRFAFEEASRRACSIRVLHTWEVPPIGAITGVPTFATPDILDKLATAELRMTAEVMAGYTQDFPEVPVEQEVLQGSPVRALRDATKHAAMVVVGSRGRGGFTGLLLGSVSHAVTQQAKCTVAVVR